MAGAEQLLAELSGQARFRSAGCARARAWVPVIMRRPVAVGHVQVMEAAPDKVAEAIKAGTHAHAWHRHKDFAGYRAEGGYALLQDALEARRTRDDIIRAVSDAGLRGLGGAGFPTGRKWCLVRAEPAPRLMAVNGDEGEVGTFKDRYLSRARSASLHRGHADRRLGGRGPRSLFLSAR